MRIVFSRKGFDSASGGGPSPIVEGRPVSLPIPAGEGRPGIPYGELGLAEHVVAHGHGADTLAHHDPMFLEDGTCLFGQYGAAQTHLENRGVGEGDVFLFFGLFREGRERPHHRIFGWLRVEEMVRLADCGEARREALARLRHPHALAMHSGNDTVWCGPGGTALKAHEELRLSLPDGPPSLWHIPRWLEQTGLSYHDRADRWHGKGVLQSVARGQEFVADVGRRQAPREWVQRIVRLIATPVPIA